MVQEYIHDFRNTRNFIFVMGKNSQGFFVPEILDENVKNDGSESSSPCYSSKE